MNRMRVFGLFLVVVVWLQLWITTRVSGYELQVLSAIGTVGLTLAAVVILLRSLDGVAGSN